MFLIAEFVEWITLIHDDAGWKFRFGEADGYPNLNPLISTFKVASVLTVIALVASPFLIPALWNAYVIDFIVASKNWVLMLFLSISFSFLWIWHHVVGKDWNGQQYVLATLSALLFVGYLYSNIV